jgi:hypothetical protein
MPGVLVVARRGGRDGLTISAVRPTVELRLTSLMGSDFMSSESREELLVRRIVDL